MDCPFGAERARTVIRFEPVPEPDGFDRRARTPGEAWLAATPEPKRPRDLWTQFKGDLADGFRNLRAYSAMFEPVGTVDHFVSCHEDRSKAYDRTTCRDCAGWINASKSKEPAARLPDPFEIEDGWFEIHLPSLQLRVSDAIPEEFRARAEHVLTRLRLRDDERVMRQRRAWYKQYQDGKLTLAGLDGNAPLIAAAVADRVPAPRWRPVGHDHAGMPPPLQDARHRIPKPQACSTRLESLGVSLLGGGLNRCAPRNHDTSGTPGASYEPHSVKSFFPSLFKSTGPSRIASWTRPGHSFPSSNLPRVTLPCRHIVLLPFCRIGSGAIRGCSRQNVAVPRRAQRRVHTLIRFGWPALASPVTMMPNSGDATFREAGPICMTGAAVCGEPCSGGGVTGAVFIRRPG